MALQTPFENAYLSPPSRALSHRQDLSRDLPILLLYVARDRAGMCRMGGRQIRTGQMDGNLRLLVGRPEGVRCWTRKTSRCLC